MRTKEVTVPIVFPVKVGKSIVRIGGELGASIQIKTKWPIAVAYLVLSWKFFLNAIKQGIRTA